MRLFEAEHVQQPHRDADGIGKDGGVIIRIQQLGERRHAFYHMRGGAGRRRLKAKIGYTRIDGD
jgi:hypothetical protein